MDNEISLRSACFDLYRKLLFDNGECNFGGWWERLLKLDCLFKLGKVRHVEGESEDDLSNILLSKLLMVAWGWSGGIKNIRNASCWHS